MCDSKGGLRYLDEWTQHHLLPIVFENNYQHENSTLSCRHGIRLTKTGNGEFTSNIFQNQINKKWHINFCAKQIQNDRSHASIAFIDVDEYLVLRNPTNKYPCISDLLESIPTGYSGLAMKWAMFKLNNQTQYQDFACHLEVPDSFGG